MEVCNIGGFEQVGKNMTAVKVGEDVFLFDAGLDIPGIVELQEESVLEFTDRLKKGGKRVQQYSAPLVLHYPLGLREGSQLELHELFPLPLPPPLEGQEQISSSDPPSSFAE